MIAEHTLDYTTYAPPLTVDDIWRDVDAHCCAHLDYPSKIVLWVHQWDYLTKEHDNLRPRPAWIFDKVEFNERGDLCAVGRKLSVALEKEGELWGVPVEVRQP